jgi:hypothetical protein
MNLEHFVFILGIAWPVSKPLLWISTRPSAFQPLPDKETTMNKQFVLLTVCLVLFSTAACIQAMPLDEAQAAYCTDMKTFGQAVMDVRTMPEEATVEDFEAAMNTVDDAYRELQNSAWELADSQTEVLQPAYNEMRSSLDAINSGTPVVEARQIISDSWNTYKATYNEVVVFSCTAQTTTQ